MIISKTPLRISLMGGGSDLRSFYEHGYGAVVTTGISKFVYLAIHRFFDPKIVLKYSRTEIVDKVSQIEHPLIRECMRVCNVDEPLELTSFADIPSAGSGLGSSSAFAVGLIKVLHAFKAGEISAERCAELACRVEIEKLGEPIGKQDQYATAIGGLNYVRFNADDSVLVEPVVMSAAARELLQRRLMLFYTGITRSARDILREQKDNTEERPQSRSSLSSLVAMAETLRGELSAGRIDSLGGMLHESWLIKQSLAKSISNATLGSLYQTARMSGAVGGKILGAGGGGFFLFYVPEERQGEVTTALKGLRHIPFRFETHGTRTLYYQSEDA